MPDPYEFRELISGRRRGPLAALSRALLRTLEIPYTAAVRVRNWRYDTGRATAHSAGVPVISVGNITLGGTGKTPTVEWLARWFAKRGVRVGLVSRGYGSPSGQPNDEALELAQKLPGVPHVLDPDRVRGARRAIDEFGCQIVLLDDAFQHRRLARDFDLVLIDALEPFGFEHVFPRGTLREKLSGWARAGALMLTRTELVDAQRRAEIRSRALAIAPRAIWLEATHAPRVLRTARGDEQPLDTFKDRRVAAFCGIGNPAGFRHALVGCGYDLVGMRTFADHFAYPRHELDQLARWFGELDVAAALCTHKDLVKIGDRWTSDTPLLALASRLEILAGESELETRLELLAQRALAR
ncbi:MAG: tetraacyldisaccharide 4'-kinase [Pirellulales bacterium]